MYIIPYPHQVAGMVDPKGTIYSLLGGGTFLLDRRGEKGLHMVPIDI